MPLCLLPYQFHFRIRPSDLHSLPMNSTKFRFAVIIVVLIAAVSLNALAAGDTRLPDAAMRSDRDTIRTLLQQKTDVNAMQPDGTTALHWAVRHDDLETAQLLLRAGA